MFIVCVTKQMETLFQYLTEQFFVASEYNIGTCLVFTKFRFSPKMAPLTFGVCHLEFGSSKKAQLCQQTK